MMTVSCLSLPHKLPVFSIVKRAPWRESTFFAIELICKINICLAIEQVTEIYAGPLEVNSIDLEVAPIERPVRVVMVNLAFTLRVLRALDGKREAAIRPEFAACILLPGREAVSVLIGLGLGGISGSDALRHDDRRLKMEADGRLETQGIVIVEPPDCAADGQSRQ